MKSNKGEGRGEGGRGLKEREYFNRGFTVYDAKYRKPPPNEKCIPNNETIKA